jgi:uncharacterized protein with von Willebrand factor type A (vWA) domain
MRNMMVRGTSNMFTAFESFMKQADISNKSYIILLSDCRDWAGPKVNGIPASVELISQMSSMAKKVVILNPEDKKKWDVVGQILKKINHQILDLMLIKILIKKNVNYLSLPFLLELKLIYNR